MVILLCTQFILYKLCLQSTAQQIFKKMQIICPMRIMLQYTAIARALACESFDYCKGTPLSCANARLQAAIFSWAKLVTYIMYSDLCQLNDAGCASAWTKTTVYMVVSCSFTLNCTGCMSSHNSPVSSVASIIDSATTLFMPTRQLPLHGFSIQSITSHTSEITS